ncbi:MAG: ferredoxin-NADP reductase [Desulfovibrio sp. S3730MH75]|nr:MAG: ferredoxin-NADP reductase [Desulfovibrio sp. S3730MH75]
MFKVISSQMIVPNLHQITLEAPAVAKVMQPGQFVILRSDEDGERIPLSVCDWHSELGTITLIFMNIGSTTNRLAALQEGECIPTVVGPLGNATEIENYGTVLCVGGCYGIGSIFPIARALKEKGNRIITVFEGRSSFMFYWQERYEHISDEIIHITRDGTSGLRGHVRCLEDYIKSQDKPIDRAIINGCTFLMKTGSETTKPFDIKTIVSLNPIMIDGTGMCGVCRVSVGSETKFACVDGPEFDGHQVDWEELLQRRKTYMKEEIVPLHTSGCEKHMTKSRGKQI